ncbi:hypothetical protein [Psychrobacillus psychrodurans]|uniref:hypothetical protein n=1 Tax=Psychrobacillus psychrodurans TaxID=126157 RepID=UPI003D02F9BD
MRNGIFIHIIGGVLVKGISSAGILAVAWWTHALMMWVLALWIGLLAEQWLLLAEGDIYPFPNQSSRGKII